jgi:hypothetical protein
MRILQEHYGYVQKKYLEKKGEFSMKKLSMLILLVIVASLLVAAIPTKMMRLTIINKSGYDVYMKLEGSPVTEAYYYLTIPAGDRDAPIIKVFTVMSDVYDRTTWQCGGLENSGLLVMANNTRLTFLPCGEAACPVQHWRPGYEYTDACGWTHTREAGWVWKPALKGEPTMEKVTYWKWVDWGKNLPKNLVADGYWNFACAQYYWDFKTFKLPVGCEFRYQY